MCGTENSSPFPDGPSAQKLTFYIHTHRYDYFPDTQEVILHMPHRKHEVVGSRVGRLIQERIEQLYAKCQVECPFEQLKASDIKSDQGDVLMPDEQIMCLDAEQPALVVEVGNSQTAEDLERKARRLVMAGKGEIRQVVTVKFHRGSRVDLTVWRPRVIDGSLTPERVDQVRNRRTSVHSVPKETLTSVPQVIRDTNAEPVPGAQLGIPMAEMAPPELLHDSLRNEIIIITSEEICKVIKRAEAYHNSVGKNRFGVRPKDAECPSSPANSVSSGPSDDEEQQQESMPEDEYKPARRMRPGEPYRSPIKARARKVNKQD